MKTVDRFARKTRADLQSGTLEDFGTVMRDEAARWSVVAGIKQE
jgi:hypothetical protein